MAVSRPAWMKWALAPVGALIVLGTVGLEAAAWVGITWEMLMGSLVAVLVAAGAAQIYRYRHAATPAQRQQTRAVVLVLALLPYLADCGPVGPTVCGTAVEHARCLCPTAPGYSCADLDPTHAWYCSTALSTVGRGSPRPAYFCVHGADAGGGGHLHICRRRSGEQLIQCEQSPAHGSSDGRRGGAGTAAAPVAAAVCEPLSLWRT